MTDEEYNALPAEVRAAASALVEAARGIAMLADGTHDEGAAHLRLASAYADVALAAACPCTAAIAAARRSPAGAACRVCGALVDHSPSRPKAPSGRSHDSTPQRWAPPRSVPQEHGPAVRQRQEDPARRWTIGDLATLRRWSSALYGKAVTWSDAVQTSGRESGGREDSRTEEWHRVMDVHRRFEALRTGAGRLHYAVLWYAVMEGRTASSEIGRGLMVEIGVAFAPKAQRVAWGKHKQRALHDALPKVAGERLWDAAVKAWEAGT